MHHKHLWTNLWSNNHGMCCNLGFWKRQNQSVRVVGRPPEVYLSINQLAIQSQQPSSQHIYPINTGSTVNKKQTYYQPVDLLPDPRNPKAIPKRHAPPAKPARTGHPNQVARLVSESTWWTRPKKPAMPGTTKPAQLVSLVWNIFGTWLPNIFSLGLVWGGRLDVGL